jgi:hypothetical protein
MTITTEGTTMPSMHGSRQRGSIPTASSTPVASRTLVGVA